jgi:bidirectional [NiFe] hydrogenase diaphorase subunit
MQQRFGINPGETTEDKALSVMSARCVGACGLAPAVVLDGNVAGKLGTEQLISRIDARIAEETAE